jgi:hypothetical protein
MLFWDPRALRGLWLEAMSRAMDDYLRSIQFLQLMEHNLRVTALPDGLAKRKALSRQESAEGNGGPPT